MTERNEMTDEEAKRMANLMWPPHADAWRDTGPCGHILYVVGHVAMCSEIYGVGLSWESAFREARERERRGMR